MTAALEGGEWSAARPGRTLPPGKTRYPLYMRLGGPQGRSGRAENLVPTGIGSRKLQPVVSHYTDWATGHTLSYYKGKGKVVPLQARCGPEDGKRYSCTLPWLAALEGGEWSAARPGRTLPSAKARYRLYRRLGGPQGRSERARNLVSTGIRSR